jgi:hypothetical protein
MPRAHSAVSSARARAARATDFNSTAAGIDRSRFAGRTSRRRMAGIHQVSRRDAVDRPPCPEGKLSAGTGVSDELAQARGRQIPCFLGGAHGLESLRDLSGNERLRRRACEIGSQCAVKRLPIENDRANGLEEPLRHPAITKGDILHAARVGDREHLTMRPKARISGRVVRATDCGLDWRRTNGRGYPGTELSCQLRVEAADRLRLLGKDGMSISHSHPASTASAVLQCRNAQDSQQREILVNWL